MSQDCVYTCPTLSQDVVARCFEYELKRLNTPECYFNSISNEFLEKRDKLVQVLKECGMKPVVPDGGYFVLADYSQLGLFKNISLRKKSIFVFISNSE